MDTAMTLNGLQYRLSFEDAFEGDALDPAKWKLCPEQRRQDAGGYWADSKTDYVFFIDGRETWRTSEPGICERPGYMKLTTEFGSWAAPVVPEELPDFCRVDWVRAWAPENL